MNKKVLCLFLAILLILSVLAGCSKKDEAREVYETYLNEAKDSVAAAISKYCHYERIDAYHMAMETPTYVVNYKINRWEQLSDNLWVARTEIVESSDEALVLNATNFVGLIHGTYKVMISIEEVPYFLTDGLDLEEYYQERAFDPDSLIMPY